MATVRVAKKFTVNMGNYESYAPEYSVELEADSLTISDLHRALENAEIAVDEAAFADLSEAAGISNIKDTFVLTWLHNRKDKSYARNH